jgi:hypothetical protein
VPRVARDLSETVGPVVTAPGEYLDGGVPEMDLYPVAIELDLVNPAFASGNLSIDVASDGSMKPG